MNEAVQELLDSTSTHHWVSIDVAAEALGINRRRAFQLAASEQWRSTTTRPKQYAFDDIRRTYNHRNPKETP